MGAIATQSLLTLKDLEQGYPSFILFSITFTTGQTIYITRANDGVNGGVSWNGQFYLSCVVNQTIGSIGGQSSIGIDIIGQISIEIADADGSAQAYENQYGFLGATLTATLVFFDPINTRFSVDSKVVFTGLCDPSTNDLSEKQTLSVTATSRNSLAKTFLPPTPIQRTCPHWFPSTSAQRADAANNAFSIFFSCGYSADIPGPNAVGNLQSNSTPYTSCSYDVSACKARGMFTTDSSGRQGYRFGGVQWDPPATFKGKQYVSAKTVQGVNTANVNKWKEYVPITFGNCWVTGVFANVVGDPNSTRGEVMFNSGTIRLSTTQEAVTTGIQAVVVNGLLIPYATQTSDLLFRWYDRTWGDRGGSMTQGAIFEGKGDPYGSIATILPIVYSQVAASNAAPSVQILVGSRPLPVFTSPTAYTGQRTNNLAWCLLEILRLLKPDLYSQIDFSSVIQYAAICSVPVTYTNLYGASASHQRFGCSLAITSKTPGQDIVESLKIAGRLMIVPNANGTALRFVCKQTLCEQQPSPVAGSNYNTGIPSFRATDSPIGARSGVGYVAYLFNESTYIQGSVKFLQDPIAGLPVVITCNINDEDNDYIQDKIDIADTVAYNVSKQVVEATLPVQGLPNYDQAYRTVQAYFAERRRGNPRGDAKGTLRIELETTYRALHLNQGDIVAFSNLQKNIAFQTFRIEQIDQTTDFRRTRYTMRWHEDAWYTDGYGQLNSPYVAGYLGDALGVHAPQPWQPSYESNQAIDWLYGNHGGDTYRSFQLVVGAEQIADGSIVAEARVIGYSPVNQISNALGPRVARQGTALGSGGTFPGGITVFVYVSAVDTNGVESLVNTLPCTIPITGGATNSVYVPIYAYPPGTASYRAYISTTNSPQTRALAATGSGTPSTITLTRYVTSQQAPIDPNFDHFSIRAKKLVSPAYALFGPGYTLDTPVTNTISASAITFGFAQNLITGQPYYPAFNSLAGKILIAAYETGGGIVPFLTLRIANNNGKAVTVDTSQGSTDLTLLNLQQTWFFLAHQIDNLATLQSFHVSLDTGVNLSSISLVGTRVRTIAGTGVGQPLRTVVSVDSNNFVHLDSPLANLDGSSIIVFEEGNWSSQVLEPSQTYTTSSVVNYGINFDNSSAQGWLVEVATQNKAGEEPTFGANPLRIYYWPGFAPNNALYQGLNLLPNPDLAAPPQSGEVAAGWYAYDSTQNAWSMSLDQGQAYTGTGSFHFHLKGANYSVASGAGLAGTVTTRYKLPVPRPGENYYFRAAGRINLGPKNPLAANTTLQWEGRVTCNYADGGAGDVGIVTGVLWPPQPPGAGLWQPAFGTLNVSRTRQPSELVCRVSALYLNNSGGTVTAFPTGDDIDIFVSGLYLVRIIDIGTEVNGNSLSGLNTLGNIIPTTALYINVNQNSNDGSGNCTIYLGWNTTTITRSDASTFTVQQGIVGWLNLAAGTTYYFYPRISADPVKTGVTQYAVDFAGSNSPTTPPTAPSQQFAIMQAFDGWFPLAPMHVTTPNNAGTGGGSGGGPSTCPEFNELVYVGGRGVIKIGNVQIGDAIRGRKWDTGEVVYRTVVDKTLEPSSVWRVVAGRKVSPTHPVSYPNRLQWQLPYKIGVLDTSQGIRVQLKLDAMPTNFDDANYDLVDEDGTAVLVMHNALELPC